MATTEERLKIAGQFVDDGIATLRSGAQLTETQWDDRLSKAADLVLADNGIARGVVVEWIERSTRGGVSALDATYDAASVLDPAGIDIGMIKDLVGFLLTFWDLIRSRIGG